MSEEDLRRREMKEAGLEVVSPKDTAKVKLERKLVGAKYRAQERIKRVPSYLKQKAAAEYSRQRTLMPARRERAKGRIKSFLESQAREARRPRKAGFDFIGNPNFEVLGTSGFNVGIGGGKQIDFFGTSQLPRARRSKKGGRRKAPRRTATIRWY